MNKIKKGLHPGPRQPFHDLAISNDKISSKNCLKNKYFQEFIKRVQYNSILKLLSVIFAKS